MSNDNVSYLPVWKKNATASERLKELAMIADKRPDLFGKMIVLYVEEPDDGTTTIRKISSGDISTAEFIGILSMAMMDMANGV